MKQRSITTMNFNITLITTLHETTTNHFLVTNALLSVNLQGMSFQQIRRHWIIDIIAKILRGRETGWWKAKEIFWYLYKVINHLNVSYKLPKYEKVTILTVVIQIWTQKDRMHLFTSTVFERPHFFRCCLLVPYFIA